MESTREDIIFPLGDLLEELQSEVCSHFPSLPTEALLQARAVNKKLAAAATRALFYKRNRSALFAQATLLNQELIDDSAVNFVSLDLLRTCLRTSPLSLVERAQIFVLMGRLLNLKITWDWPEEKQVRVKQLITVVPNQLLAGRDRIWQLLRIHIAVSSPAIALDYLPFLMERIKINDDLDKENAIQAFYSIESLLDQSQLQIYLGEIKAMTSSAKNYWSLKKIALWRPILKKIAARLGPKFTSSYIKLVMVELKYDYSLFNVLILTSFAPLLSIDEIPAWLTELLIHRLENNESAIVILNAIAALASNNLMSKAEMQNGLTVIIEKFYTTNNCDVNDAAICAARILATKVDSHVPVQLLSDCIHIKKSFVLAILAPVLSVEQLQLYIPYILDNIEGMHYVIDSFLTASVILHRLEPKLIDSFIEKLLVYFSSDIAHVKLADNSDIARVKLIDEWLLVHWEQLSVSNRAKCYSALRSAIDRHLVINDSIQNHWRQSANMSQLLLRLRYVSTLFSPEEANDYLSEVLAKLKLIAVSSPDHFLPCLQGLYAIIVRMNKEDVKSRLDDIIQLIPSTIINFAETINLLSYFIVSDICSLAELKKMPKLNNLDTDYSLALLEKMAEWHANVDAAPKIKVISASSAAPDVAEFKTK